MILGAEASPDQFVGGGLALLGALGAIVATLRYIKRTEDDTVEGLRQRVIELATEVTACRAESRVARVEQDLLHRQVVCLLGAMQTHGIAIPDNYPRAGP